MRSLLLFVFGVFAVCRIEASPIAHEIELNPKCAQGQAYWCQSITTAKSCSAVEHCNQMVWNIPTQAQPKFNEDKTQCKICFELMQIVRDQMKNDSTRKYLKNLLNTTCDAIHFESVIEACYVHVDIFIPQLSRTLYEYLDPKNACGTDCNALDVIERTNKPVIDDHIGFYQLLRDNEFIPQIDSIDMEKIDVPCALCTELFTTVKQSINKTSKAEFKNILKSLCKNVHVGKSECLDWFDGHSDEIYNILNKLDPESACLQIGLCPKKTKQSVEGNAMENWNDYQSMFDDDDDDDLFKIDTIPLPSDDDLDNGLSSIECTLCEEVINKVQKEIGRNKSTEYIKDVLNYACEMIPEKRYRRTCEKFIEKDGDKIIDEIIKGETSKFICAAIGLCFADEPTLNEIQMSPVECLECQHILKGVEAKVGNDRSKEHVEAVLQEQCSSITNADLKKKCFAFVQDHNDYIVNALMNNKAPKQICKDLQFCASRPTVQIVSQMMEKYSDTPQCVVCQMIAVNLENLLRKNSTIEEIDDAVRTVCKYVPKEYSPKCEEFVENYAELAISYLLSASPKELCLGMNFCRSSVKKDTSHRDILECGVCNTVVDALATVYSHDGSKDMDIVSETTCHLIPLKHQKECIDLMHVYGVSLSILLNRSEKQSEVCAKIGKCFADGDDSIFHEIKGAIYNTENDVNSEKYSEIAEQNKSNDLNRMNGIFNFDDATTNIFDETSKVDTLLDAKKCTFEPKYWCSSKKAMDECNAHIFCKKYAVLLFF